MFRKSFLALLLCIIVSSCGNTFNFNPNTVISVENMEQSAVAEWFAWLFATSGGFVPKVEVNAEDPDVLLMENPSLDATSYRIRITEKKVYVEASSSLGFFYAMQYIKSLLPIEIDSERHADNVSWNIPVMSKDSCPSACYAGLVVDLYETYMSKANLLHLIESMPDMGLYDFYLLNDVCYTAEDIEDMCRCAFEHHVEVLSEQIIVSHPCF